ncbi:hypothetical protein [Streptomyces sp. 7N604]|uniref:hypothetical protein n=1 Tax=Streptomyces sp. 7N604 TaxID=3457415 RepID=UPI003FD2FA9D
MSAAFATAAFAAPLRAVDRVETTFGPTGTRLRAYKKVSADDPYMAGHFPGLTMLPAMFLLEGLRQAVAQGLADDGPPELLEVRSARMLAPMPAGDEIGMDVAVEPLAQSADAGIRWALTARCARRDGTPVAVVKAVVGTPRTDGLQAPAPPPARTGRPPSADHARIRQLLPVRHPMLLVDRVASVEAGREICAVKAVTGSEPCYQGLPEGLSGREYAYPRSLSLESFGQAAALLWLETVGGGGVPDGVLMLAAIRDCRFEGAVYPGDVLRHVVRLDQLVGDNAFLSGEIWVDDRCLASMGSLIAVNRPRTQLM